MVKYICFYYFFDFDISLDVCYRIVMMFYICVWSIEIYIWYDILSRKSEFIIKNSDLFLVYKLKKNSWGEVK